MSVLLVTSLGDIVVDLHADRCPLTSKNFLKLCKIKYYNGCLFHTVQKDFTAQTGDPTGTGTGGDSIYKYLYGDQARFFNDEIHLDLKHSKMGTVAMASAGENLNASQFYITLRDDLDYLDGKHTVFGEVAEGFETLARINEAYLDEDNRPYKNIRIKHTYILEDPFDDPSQLAELIPDASPEGKPKDEVDDKARLEDDWVPMDEQLGTSELEEVLRAKQAHSSAVVLESIGDIPDAEIKPPDNVLFVCKLNPVTEDEDLHTIFSRFGIVTSAEVIRDFKTGDSLCYAFIEFETNEACEQAYFKMDNALIDDRRIHVDFSQSVSKLWNQFRRKDNQGKGRGCFKCGALDHIAKDCTGGGGGGDVKQPSKFILKDNNRQHGGSNDSKYEMVFDGDTPGREKRHRSYDADDQGEKQKPKRQSEGDLRHRDGEKNSGSWHKESDGSGHKEEMIREDKANRSKRDRDQSVERIGSHKHKEKHLDVNAESGYHREYRKRYAEGEGRRDDRDYKKRDVEDEGQRNGRDYKKRDVEGEGRRDDKKRGEEGGSRRDDKKRGEEGGSRRDDKKRDAQGEGRGDHKRDMDGGDRRDHKKRDVEGEGHRDHKKRDMDGGDRRDHKKRDVEGEGHRDHKKRDMDGGDRRGRDEREYRKRDVDGGDRKYDRDYRKRDAESDRRDRRDMKEERGRDRG